MDPEHHGHHPFKGTDFHFRIDATGWHLDIDTSTRLEMLAQLEAAERYLLATEECGNLDFRVT